jgi:uncharacterized membrane protein YtjA (UPF0391 family)
VVFGWSLVAAVVGALLAFGGVANGTSAFAPALYFLFIVMFVGSLVWGLAPGHRRTRHPHV